jgi:hypothetical protein
MPEIGQVDDSINEWVVPSSRMHITTNSDIRLLQVDTEELKKELKHLHCCYTNKNSESLSFDRISIPPS